MKKKIISPHDFYNQQYYERHEFGYTNEESQDAKQILKLVQSSKKKEVLEIGCGLGVLLAKIPAKKKIGTEINDFAVQTCQKRGLPVIKADVEKGLLFKDSAFDIIIMNQVVSHLQKPYVALKECFRLLKPGGKILITTPIRSVFFHDISETHLHEMTLQELKRLVEKSGFQIIDHRANGISFLYPLLENILFKPGRVFKRLLYKKPRYSKNETKKTQSSEKASFFDLLQGLADKTLLKPLSIYRRHFLQLGLNQLILAVKR